MSEVLRRRVKTRYIWFDPEDYDSLMSGVEEETYEPLDLSLSEFSGVVGTLSLGHGVAPPEPAAEWSILKIYEKSVIWIRHGPGGASP